LEAPVDPPAEVQTVVISAARLPEALGAQTFSLTRLEGGDLVGSVRLDEALGQVPGVALFRRTSSSAANPTIQGISLRNIAPSGAGRALVTLDSIPQNDPFGGWVIWSSLPSEGLSGLSILRGSGAGPYGAGALTGVIALEEHGQTDGLAAAEMSITDAINGRAAASAGFGGFLFTGAIETGDGYVPVRGAGRGAVDEKTTLDAWSVAGRYLAEIGNALAALRFSSYDEKRGGGVDGLRSGSSGHTASLTIVRPPEDMQLGWRLQGWYRASDLENVFLAVDDDRNGARPASHQYATPATGWGMNAALRGEAMGFGWELGADARFTDGESREFNRNLGAGFTRERVAGGRTSVAGVYAEGTRDLGAWLLTGGIRVDRWTASDGHRTETNLENGLPVLELSPEDRDGWVRTARVGARRELSDSLWVRAAAYSGFRAPTLNELHRPFRVGNDITEANSDLEPEKLYGAEIGVGGDIGLNWQATVFYNHLADPITNVTIGFGPGNFPVAGFVPAGGTLRQRQNAGSIDAVGIEADVGGEVADGLTLRGGVLANWARVDGGSAAPQLDDLEPAQTPRIAFTLRGDWEPAPNVILSTNLRYEGRRFEDDKNSRTLSAAFVANVRAGWRIFPNTEIFAAVDNLFDADVEIGESGDGLESYSTPRIFRMGLSYRR
jgi:vitamin B12 transporter